MAQYNVGDVVQVKRDAAFCDKHTENYFRAGDYKGVVREIRGRLYVIEAGFIGSSVIDLLFEFEIECLVSASNEKTQETEPEKSQFEVGYVVRVKPDATWLCRADYDAFTAADFVGVVRSVVPAIGAVPFHLTVAAGLGGEGREAIFLLHEIDSIIPEPEPEQVEVRASSLLADIWYSVTSFYDRFGVELTPDMAWSNLMEESNEFTAAAERYIFGSGSEQAVATEFADVLYTLVGCAASLGLTAEQLSDATASVLEKNNRKTILTHRAATDIATGQQKITRRTLAIIAPSPEIARRIADGRRYRYITSAIQLRGFAGEIIIAADVYNFPHLRSAIEEAAQIAEWGSAIITRVEHSRDRS